MGFGDLVRHWEIGSNTIIMGNIDGKCVNLANLPKNVTFVKVSVAKSERVIDTKSSIANALWEIN